MSKLLIMHSPKIGCKMRATMSRCHTLQLLAYLVDMPAFQATALAGYLCSAVERMCLCRQSCLSG